MVKNNKEKDIKDVLEELQKDVLHTELVQDNKLHFQCENNVYRARMPDQKEQNEATQYKNKTYIKLLQEENTVTLQQLKDILKKKGIDIEKIDKQLNELEKDMMQCYLSLYNKTDKKGIKKYKNELEKIREKRMNLIIEKSNLLSPAIEYQAQDEYYRYLTAYCTEVFVEKRKSNKKKKAEIIQSWKPAWNSFDEFLKDRSKLRLIALGKLTELLLSV